MLRLVHLLGTAIASLSSVLPTAVEGHGYLASPRSRNFYAHEMTSWTSVTADDPEPEPDPQSLNQGTLCGATGNHDYNLPRNALGGPMKTNIQVTWRKGEEVVVDVALTAHHKVRSVSCRGSYSLRRQRSIGQEYFIADEPILYLTFLCLISGPFRVLGLSDHRGGIADPRLLRQTPIDLR
jgi:hypothetical protein